MDCNRVRLVRDEVNRVRARSCRRPEPDPGPQTHEGDGHVDARNGDRVPLDSPTFMTEAILFVTEAIEVPQISAVLNDLPVPRLRSRWGTHRSWISAASFASVTALCVWMGFYTTFNFSLGQWDDEGYSLHQSP